MCLSVWVREDNYEQAHTSWQRRDPDAPASASPRAKPAREYTGLTEWGPWGRVARAPEQPHGIPYTLYPMP